MSLNFPDLAPLAGAVEKAGAPILGAALRAGSTVATAAPFPLNLVLPVVLNGVANAVGGDASNPAGMAQTINADPNAVAEKIQAVEDQHKDDLQNALDMAKLQTDQTGSYLTADIPNWMKFFFGGWRPMMGWLGSFVVFYQVIGVTLSWRLIPVEMFNVVLITWGSLAGFRTIDKWQGSASPVAATPTRLKRIVRRTSR
jgi:hypothetical protein